MYYVYFLESINNPSKHYIGFTKNIRQRITSHNQGIVKSTNKFRPWKVIYTEIYINEQDARGREKFLKSGSGWKFLRKQLKNYLNK